MGTDETLASREMVPDNAAEPYSANWWHGLSTEELRGLISGGFGTAGFEGASLEAERRVRERRKADDEKARVEADHKKRLRLIILEGVLLFSLLVLIATDLLR
jgi:hypothetical protein